MFPSSVEVIVTLPFPTSSLRVLPLPRVYELKPVKVTCSKVLAVFLPMPSKSKIVKLTDSSVTALLVPDSKKEKVKVDDVLDFMLSCPSFPSKPFFSPFPMYGLATVTTKSIAFLWTVQTLP